MEVFRKYPLISTWDKNKVWTGLIKLQNEYLNVTFGTPNYPSLDGLTLKFGTDTMDLLQSLGIKPTHIKQIFSCTTGASLVEALDVLADLVTTRMKVNGSCEPAEVLTTSGYQQVVEELKVLEDCVVEECSQDLRKIRISCMDPSGRIHEIVICVPSNYPHQKLTVLHDLPCSSMAWPSTIPAAVREFKMQLEKFNLFWAEMDILDDEVACFEPLKQKRSHTHRNILLSNNVVMLLQVQPLSPQEIPGIHFRGNAQLVAEVGDAFWRNSTKWNPGCSILDNLRVLVPANLPGKHAVVYQEDEMMCHICYAYDLQGSGPNVYCGCGIYFHAVCLHDMNEEVDQNESSSEDVSCPTCSCDLRLSFDQGE